jgi:hypothetical protein
LKLLLLLLPLPFIFQFSRVCVAWRRQAGRHTFYANLDLLLSRKKEIVDFYSLLNFAATQVFLSLSPLLYILLPIGNITLSISAPHNWHVEHQEIEK